MQISHERDFFHYRVLIKITCSDNSREINVVNVAVTPHHGGGGEKSTFRATGRNQFLECNVTDAGELAAILLATCRCDADAPRRRDY